MLYLISTFTLVLSSLVVFIRFFRIECSMLSEVRIGEKDITVKATTGVVPVFLT
jgi:hypothetical protein